MSREAAPFEFSGFLFLLYQLVRCYNYGIMKMNELTDLITGDFEEALEVKNSKSLQRGIDLLLCSSVEKEQHEREQTGTRTAFSRLNNSVELIASRMEEAFKRKETRQ